MSAGPLIELRNISCSKDSTQLVFKYVNLAINQGDIVVLRGKSGSGKTTLLKCIAHLILYGGDILYRGSPPSKYGIPYYRTRVLYVPQRPSLLPGSPQDFLLALSSLDAHKKARSSGNFERIIDIARGWGVDPQLWDREWSNLSGGEAQRIALATAIGLGTAEIILLDEPTSALDSVSCAAVEKTMTNEIKSIDSPLKAIVWITHSDEQGSRVGTRFIQIAAAGCFEDPMPLV